VTLITATVDPHNAKSSAYAKTLHARRDQLGLNEAALFVSDEFTVAEADVASLYAVADALFFPSRQEGFGLPVVEAALHRLPIFCADIGPMNTLLQHGLHVFDQEASPGEIAKVIERTLDRSAPYRARREALRKYAWSAVWKEHLEPLSRAK
jgi:glycosyltransferase involved in cell wall biosynthesis